MSGRTSIEWTGRTWNPIRARLKADATVKQTANRFKVLPAGTWGYYCERISPGCQNCYAERMNGRTLPAWGTGLDYTVLNRDKVEIYLDEEELLKPLHWKKPQFVFPCSMTDMFAPFVTWEMIDRVFSIMAQAKQHTFQVLTKRAMDMRGWSISTIGTENCSDSDARRGFRLPLPNVWLGVSVEDQQHADERIPHLLRTPAAMRWVSYEPALGPVDFFSYMPCAHEKGGCENCRDLAVEKGIDWLVAGGESGPGARPLDLAWLRSAREQCAAAGVPFFCKQLGARPGDSSSAEYRAIPERYRDSLDIWLYGGLKLKDRKGGDPAEWPADLRVRELPAIAAGGARHAS